MSRDKGRPGDARRAKGRKPSDPSRPRFKRPVEWAQSELDGVTVWLARLKGPEGESYPEGWRLGQIKHYERRIRLIRTELKKHVAAAARRKREGGTDSGVA